MSYSGWKANADKYFRGEPIVGTDLGGLSDLDGVVELAQFGLIDAALQPDIEMLPALHSIEDASVVPSSASMKFVSTKARSVLTSRKFIMRARNSMRLAAHKGPWHASSNNLILGVPRMADDRIVLEIFSDYV
jgi:hypothetical protein